MHIEPGRIIDDFFEKKRCQYAIPVYQRNYEWPEEQCTKLFEDIMLAFQRDKKHFCGSVVYSLLNEINNIYQYVIIDGQQRLTTIYILLKALLDCAVKDSDKELISESLYNTDKYGELKITELTKLKLKPIKSDNKQMLYLMNGRYDEMDPTSGVWKNYELFVRLIKNYLNSDDDRSVKDVYKGIEKLTCAKIQLDSDDNAQEIFERINSTGLPLSLADKIRNYVLMTDGNQEELYENYWLKTELLVGRDNMSDFFLDYLNLKMDSIPKESDAYEQFKKILENNPCNSETMLKEILHYGTLYHTFSCGDEKHYSKRVNELLYGLRYLKQTTCHLFMYPVFIDFENGIITTEVLEKVLVFLQNYSIRRIVCDISSNSLRGLYKSLYNRLYSVASNKENYYDTLVSFFMQITSKDALPDEKFFVECLKYKNLYRKNACCKFLLAGIENQGKEKLEIGNLSIEHIMPQNKNISKAWQDMLGDDWEYVKDKYLHTLGNLSLTGYNSELGDKPFEEKKKLISEEKTKVVILFEDVLNKPEWNQKTIEERADRLASIISELYSIEKPDHLIEYKEPGYTEYNLDIPENATSTYINYYVLQGERVKVTNYAEMLRSVIRKLYEYDKSVIEQMAQNNEMLFPGSEYPMFSCDKTAVKGGKGIRIRGTDIYQSTGFSASYIIYIIKALLNRYEVDENDFVYSAKTSNNAIEFDEADDGE
ncbi:Uncharacterized conserved protein, contains ParB-like and HNH nuclease domains [[Clostridium] aminophilum]|uniref:Uncharacterized conserved protein, contains ParB-like and HNH nuclease domains n=1 Tax=[Clostridium] aminophilum TaxID=1526 RepID=A0A1I0AEV3_9FIRM|nr:DUF262 domain-containing protein [[Clostridium] aminophilum]SES92703.1 Uncharacterized conserved protein, contains ParB-like and HNH nuclease domains [[Clostridium] aminophilum]